MVFKLTVLEALQKHSIQAVATVIEQKGCYGFDKYLRISNEESIKTNALKAIENFCYHSTVFFDDLERLKNLGTKNEDYSKLDWLDKCTNELKKFGWLDEFLPDFSDSNPSEIVVRNKDEDHPRRVNTTYIIIAALFHYHDLKLEDSNNVDLLERLTEEIGVPVGDETIRDILSAIPSYLEKRRKACKKT